MTKSIHRGLLSIPPQAVDAEGKAALIESSGWAKDFQWKEILRLAKYFDVHSCPINFEIVVEGDPGDFMAVIAEGSCKVVKRSGSGDPKTIVTLHRGSTLGELCLVDNQPRAASVISAVPCKLLVLPQGRFKIMLEQEPDICARLLIRIAKTLGGMLRQASGRLVEFLEC